MCQHAKRELGDLVVIHLAASAKGPGFNSSIFEI